MNKLWINLKLNEIIYLYLIYKIIYKNGLTKLPKYDIIITVKKREDKVMATTYERTIIDKLINNNIIIDIVNYEFEVLKLERNFYYIKVAQNRANYIIKETIKKEIEKMDIIEAYNINVILNEVIKGIRRK